MSHDARFSALGARLALWGHHQAKALVFLTFLLAAAGVFLARDLPVSLFPNVDFPHIVVSADAGDMPADQMVAEVTRPLEQAVNSIPGVVAVRSTTGRGACDLSLNFDWHVDMDQTYTLVQGRLNDIRPSLPADTSLDIKRMRPSIYPVVGYSLTSDTLTPVQLSDQARLVIKPLLSRVPGVARIDVMGDVQREALVQVDPARLQAYHLTLAQVATAIGETNDVSAVGKLQEHYQLYLTVVDGRYASYDEIARTVVTSAQGQPVTVGDLASVGPSTKPQWIRVTADGHPAVIFNVIQQPGGNTVAIEADIEQALARLKAKLPAGVALAKYYDQAELVKESENSVRDSMGVGVLLGAAVLYMFLRRVSITLIAVATVPLTVAITVILLSWVHESFNIMTLGGLAAAIGLVIDDAIVMVENIVHHLQSGAETPLEATRLALGQQWKPFLGSSISSVIVFLPLAFLTGVTGAFFKSLSLTMACALVISLGLSLLVVPLAVGRFVKAGQVHEPRHGRPAQAFRAVSGFLFRRAWVVGLLAVAMLAGSFTLYRTLPNGFLPEMDEGAFTLDYYTPPGTSLSETARVVSRVEKIVTDTPEVASYSLRTGTQMGGALTEPNEGDILVRLKSGPRRPIDAVMDDVRQRVADAVPGIHVEFTQLLEDAIGDMVDVPQPVQIKLFGDNVTQLRALAHRIADAIPRVPGVVDVDPGVKISGAALRVRPDPILAGRYGLTTADVRQALSGALEGTVASTMLEGENVVGIRVRYPDAARDDTAALEAVQVPTASAQAVAMGRVAQVSVQPGEAEITRENVKPMVAVTARIEGQSLGGTVERIQAYLAKAVPLPPGVFVEYGGLYKEQQASFKGLMIATVAAITLIATLLLFMFQSFAAALAIAIVDAMATLGILVALWVTGTALNISSMMGAVMIVGIVAENAIFLLHAVQLRLAAGQPLHEALTEGALSRARPIVMTTLAAVLALLPLALGMGAGAQMQRPLAVAVIGGFSLSSLLLLFALPVLYGTFLRLAGGGSRGA